MGIGKQNSAFGQPINVRSTYSRVSTKAANPIVHVIHRKKKYVRLILWCRGSGCECCAKELSSVHSEYLPTHGFALILFIQPSLQRREIFQHRGCIHFTAAGQCE